jgi:hypothetical protein
MEAEARQWQIGRRLSRNDTNEQGTVVEADRSIKVKWDGGSTSYFRRLPANLSVIQLTRVMSVPQRNCSMNISSPP